MGRFCVIKYLVLLSETSPQCHRREPFNLVSLLEGGIGDRKLVCDWLFAPLLHNCSLLRAPSPINCALLCVSVIGQQQLLVIGTKLIQSCHALKLSSFICDIFSIISIVRFKNFLTLQLKRCREKIKLFKNFFSLKCYLKWSCSLLHSMNSPLKEHFAF